MRGCRLEDLTGRFLGSILDSWEHTRFFAYTRCLHTYPSLCSCQIGHPRSNGGSSTGVSTDLSLKDQLEHNILLMSLDAMAPFAKQAMHFRDRCEEEITLARSQNMSSSALAALSGCKAKADTFVWLTVRALNVLNERELKILATAPKAKSVTTVRPALYAVVENMASLVYSLAAYAERVGNSALVGLMEDARAFEILFTIERVAFPSFLRDTDERVAKARNGEELLWNGVADGRSWIIFVLQHPGLNLAHALVCLYNALLGNENTSAASRIVKGLRNRSKTCAALQKYLELLLSYDASLLFHGETATRVDEMRVQLTTFRVAVLRHFGKCVTAIGKAVTSKAASRAEGERLLGTLKFAVDPVEGTFLRFMRTLQPASACYDSWNVVMQRELLLLLTQFLGVPPPLCRVPWLFQCEDFVHTYVRFLYFTLLKLYNHGCADVVGSVGTSGSRGTVVSAL